MAGERGSLDRLKRQTYVVILLVGLVGASSAWMISELVGTNTPFTRAIFPTTIAFTVLQLWLLCGKGISVRLVEESTYVVVSVIMLCVLIYALYLNPPPPLPQISLVSLYLWFPFIYVFIFLAYESRGALLRSGTLYLLALCVSLPHALAVPGLGEGRFEGSDSLGLFYVSTQFYVSTASIIAVLFFLTRIKSQLRESQAVAERMSALASTDALTGLLNRRQIELSLDEEMERASRYGLPLSLIAFDLDDFKRLNDAHGHDAGDSALIQVSRLIESHLRANDRFGRWGGEEFAIVAAETSAGPAQQLAERLKNAIEDYRFGPERRLSASFGVATYRRGDDRIAFLKRADVALYRAKERGKNRVEV